jgi:BioD-like phosphotransacetylase family protein
MPALVLLSPAPLSGKTTIAAGLARRLKAEGHAVSLSRSGDDGNASTDKALLARISGPSDTAIKITEGPAGVASITEGNQALVVVSAGLVASELAEFCRPIGGKLAGVVLNRVPARRAAALKAAAEGTGIRVIGLVPEDRLLASPTLDEVARALDAETLFLNSSGDRPLDRTLIASISADPGQGYFTRTGADTVIVRSDKPDLQLAALNAGAGAMIVTGGLPILGYVLDRAEDDMIPLLRTKLETGDAVRVIEELCAAGPFAGGDEKLQRAAELAASIDVSPIAS